MPEAQNELIQSDKGKILNRIKTCDQDTKTNQ